MNALQIEGTLLEKQEVRYTPAGIEVFEGILQYTGEQLGKTLKITGFLAPRYMRGNNLIVHIKEYI